MLREFPVFHEKINIQYENVLLKEVIERYGELNPPTILINGNIFSDGHVPIIKKLSRELFTLINGK
jgi:hypothetical protein